MFEIMFEKEAGKHSNEVLCSVCEHKTCDDTHLVTLKCREWRDRRAGFYCGAEFGYNKANEWHYVKDGKYPTDDKKVLCILGDFENDNLEVGYYSQVEGDSKRWRFENYDLPDDSEEDWGVSAWKEIVLPKESE